jgi:hypothetical protein
MYRGSLIRFHHLSILYLPQLSLGIPPVRASFPANKSIPLIAPVARNNNEGIFSPYADPIPMVI